MQRINSVYVLTFFGNEVEIKLRARVCALIFKEPVHCSAPAPYIQQYARQFMAAGRICFHGNILS